MLLVLFLSEVIVSNSFVSVTPIVPYKELCLIHIHVLLLLFLSEKLDLIRLHVLLLLFLSEKLDQIR